MSRSSERGGWTEDRRDSYRLAVVNAAVEVVGAGAPPLTVLDLSASGGALALGGGKIEDLGRPLRLRLGGLPPFPVGVEPVRELPSGAERVLGVRLVGLEGPGQAALARFLLSGFLEESRRGRPARAGFASVVVGRRAVADCLRLHGLVERRPLRLRESGGLPRALRIEAVEDGLVRAALAEPGGGALAEGESYEAELPGGQALHTFSARLLRLDGPLVAFEAPRSLLRVGFRSSPRAAVPPGVRLEARVDHPRLRLARLVKPVLEVSARGLSMPLEPERDLLVPGDRFPDLVLSLPGGRVVARAVLRSVSVGGPGGQLRCGLELLGLDDPEQAERWSRFVFGAGHPRLELGKRETLGEAWRVLRSSGYLEEAEGDEPVLRRRFFSAWGRVADDRSVSRFFLLRERGEAVGTLALNLVCPGTWLVHHLGIDEEARRRDRAGFFDIAREVYSGNAFLLGHLAAADHFLLYVNADKPWNELMYTRFLAEHPRPDDFVYDRFGVYRLPLDRAAPAAVAAGVELVRPEGALLAEVSARLAARLPAVEVDGLAYDADSIALERFAETCEAHRYRRKRHLRLALGPGGEPLALLVAEVGPDGLNLFGLLDRCRTIPLADEPHREAERLLRAEASRVYLAEHKSAPLYLARPDESPASLAAEGLSRVADGIRWLARRAILPAYQHYIDELLGSSAASAARSPAPAKREPAARGGA